MAHSRELCPWLIKTKSDPCRLLPVLGDDSISSSGSKYLTSILPSRPLTLTFSLSHLYWMSSGRSPDKHVPKPVPSPLTFFLISASGISILPDTHLASSLFHTPNLPQQQILLAPPSEQASIQHSHSLTWSSLSTLSPNPTADSQWPVRFLLQKCIGEGPARWLNGQSPCFERAGISYGHKF